MKPYIACHMVATLDGRIDCAMIEPVSGPEYYEALEELGCPSMLNGKTTAVLHYAAPGEFPAGTPIGKTCFHKARSSQRWHVIADTRGTLLWNASTLEGRDLVCLVSEEASGEYLAYLAAKGISYIACGKGQIDLARGMEILQAQFGVQRLALTGGGAINGAFLQAGLIDEISMQIAAGIDGRVGMTAAFDGIGQADKKVTALKLVSVRQMGETVWMRYRFA